MLDIGTREDAVLLRTQNLDTWWQFACAVRSLDVAHSLPGTDRAILEKHALRTAFDGNDNLIAFRNSYAHGATPSAAACVAHLTRVQPRLAERIDRGLARPNWSSATRNPAGGSKTATCDRFGYESNRHE